MSYYPEILLKKYVSISSDVIFADKDRNREEIHKIWETCFGDEAELVDFYLVDPDTLQVVDEHKTTW